MSWEFFDEERIGEFAVESFDFDDEFDSLEPWEYDERRVANEDDEFVEFIELAEEAARVELAEFGCIAIETGLSDAEWDETSNEFWEFACDLWDEPRSYVLTELM